MSTWEKIHSSRMWGKYPNEELVRFIGKNLFSIPMDKRKDIRILEVGVGQGANIWFLLNEGFDVYGFDISKSAIEKLKNFLKEKNLLPEDHEKRFLVVDMREEFPFKLDFDIIIDSATTLCSTYTEHFKIYENLYKALKNGGIFWLFHILKGSWGYGTGNLIDKDTFDNTSEGPLKDQGVIYYADICDLINILQTASFQIVSKEILTRTYENTSKLLSWAIIQAQKTK